MAVRRGFGFIDDASAGGSEYDELVAGAIPDPDTFWPVTGGTLDKNIANLPRDDEITGRRATNPPQSFRARPVLTVPGYAYHSLLKKAFRKGTGATETVSAGPAPYTHTQQMLGYGTVDLPPVNASLVRDDEWYKISGAVFERVYCTFPLDGYGTFECELHGLYGSQFPGSPPTPAFSGLSKQVMMLRDAQMFIDGSASAIPDLQGFEFTVVNNVESFWYPKRNVQVQTLGTPAQLQKLWFPGENRVGAMPNITYAINLSRVNTAQELAYNFAQVQKFVFEVTGGPLASGGTELMRVTIYAGEHTGGGPDALTARDRIQSRYEGSAYYSEVDGKDIQVEFVDDVATVTT